MDVYSDDKLTDSWYNLHNGKFRIILRMSQKKARKYRTLAIFTYFAFSLAIWVFIAGNSNGSENTQTKTLKFEYWNEINITRKKNQHKSRLACETFCTVLTKMKWKKETKEKTEQKNSTDYIKIRFPNYRRESIALSVLFVVNKFFILTLSKKEFSRPIDTDKASIYKIWSY